VHTGCDVPYSAKSIKAVEIVNRITAAGVCAHQSGVQVTGRAQWQGCQGRETRAGKGRAWGRGKVHVAPAGAGGRQVPTGRGASCTGGRASDLWRCLGPRDGQNPRQGPFWRGARAPGTVGHCSSGYAATQQTGRRMGIQDRVTQPPAGRSALHPLSPALKRPERTVCRVAICLCVGHTAGPGARSGSAVLDLSQGCGSSSLLPTDNLLIDEAVRGRIACTARTCFRWCLRHDDKGSASLPSAATLMRNIEEVVSL